MGGEEVEEGEGYWVGEFERFNCNVLGMVLSPHFSIHLSVQASLMQEVRNHFPSRQRIVYPHKLAILYSCSIGISLILPLSRYPSIL